MTLSGPHILTWCIVGLSTAGVILRPLKWPEAIWAAAGAPSLIGLGLLPFGDRLKAVGEGLDVYLFLIGMMLLSELARREGLFDAVAAISVNLAQGSKARLFLLIYGVGVVVTAFLSNDATAVVLTPAVFAVARKAKVEPLPLLLICAFVANAASFVLPISNPANLVLYRQAQIYARQGINLDRSTLADWTGRAAWLLKPLHTDETTAPVLDPGRGRTKTGQLWAYARDDRPWSGPDPPGVVYV
jgi:di/tricarboxylate transporter